LTSVEDGGLRAKGFVQHLENLRKQQQENQKLYCTLDCQLHTDETAFALLKNQVRNSNAEEKECIKRQQDLKSKEDVNEVGIHIHMLHIWKRTDKNR